MGYSVYKLIHLIGIITLFFSLGVTVTSDRNSAKWAGALHGIALLVIFVAGFGMLAKLGYHSSMPAWAIGKMVIWLVLGASYSLAKRKAIPGIILVPVLIALGSFAAYLGLFKPFFPFIK